MISAITIVKSRSFVAVGFILLAIATLIGLWSIYDILTKGLIVTNLTQYVPWGIWIAAYVFFATGLAAGSFFLSTLVYVFKLKHLEPIGKLALLQTFAILSMGLLLVFLDLGKPFKIFLIATSFNPSSLLAWLFLLYGFYITIIIAKMYFAMRNDFLLRYRGRSLNDSTLSRYSVYAATLGVVGIVFAIFTRVTSASFFAVVSANPNWFGAVLPVQFLLLGFVSGGALLMTLSILFLGDNEENRQALKTLSYFILGFLVFHFLILILEFFITLYAGTPNAKEIYLMILFGRYWYIFWLVQFALGILVPVIIILFNKRFHFIRSMFVYGIAVFVGSFGFFLNFVIPGQINPNFKELPESHHHLRYTEGYFASFTEWALFIGCVAFFIWILMAGIKYLPVIDKTEEKNS